MVDDGDRDILREIARTMRETAESYRGTERRLEVIEGTLEKLRRTLYEGNGDSMQVRLKSLERAVADHDQHRNLSSRGRWDIRVALISALGALGAAAVALFK